MKPVIGITCYDFDDENIHRLSRNFIKAVSQVGGLPIIIPTIEREEDYNRYLDIIDGLILTGGEDVHPLRYGEDPINETRYFSMERDEYEINLFKRAYEKNLSVLGICRGLQVINVAMGGTLYQDIPKQVANAIGHKAADYTLANPYHMIKIEKSSIMNKIYNEEYIGVNSFHHQGIKDLGKNLRITSRSSDGVIESIEGEGKNFLLGLQYHPEILFKKNEEHLKVFKAFIDSINL